jgi:hypothetical protein
VRETFDVPEDDQFMAMTEHDAATFRYSKSYLGIARGDDVVFIQITASSTRTVDQKKSLFRRIAEVLGEDPGIRQEDVFVNLAAVAKQNRRFGKGLAQYA